MKVTNWRKKIAAALIAGGVMAPTALRAAPLDTNLIVDPGFEDVDTGTTCCYDAVKLNSWADGTQSGFAYAYTQNYDNGGPLAGGGDYYFTANGDDGIADITTPEQVAQNIGISTGDSGALIAISEAAYNVSAFFSSYLTNGDFGTVHVDFLDGGGASLGTGQISEGDVSTWSQHSGTGL